VRDKSYIADTRYKVYVHTTGIIITRVKSQMMNLLQAVCEVIRPTRKFPVQELLIISLTV